MTEKREERKVKSVPLALVVTLMIACITGAWALSQTVAMASYAAQVEVNRIETISNRQSNAVQDIKIERITTLLENITSGVEEIKVSLRDHTK